ncbi:MAG: hypothetical protein FJW14_07405 [Acidimicrobiia bacterium]|nr:hypothetical protein [Acidimicrobiia bacterium]
MRTIVTVAVLAGVLTVPGSGGQDRSTALQAFADGVARYAALRARYQAPLPSFDARRDAWSLHLSRLFLASAIRTARSTARLGDVFTPPVAQVFRAEVTAAVHDAGIDGLVDDEDGAPLVDLTVNEPVPGWAMQPVPAALAARLPALPDAVEYRRVGDALVLWDARAGILIDALPHAFVG